MDHCVVSGASLIRVDHVLIIGQAGDVRPAFLRNAPAMAGCGPPPKK